VIFIGGYQGNTKSGMAATAVLQRDITADIHDFERLRTVSRLADAAVASFYSGK
jgi:hypothetical protein